MYDEKCDNRIFLDIEIKRVTSLTSNLASNECNELNVKIYFGLKQNNS